MTCVYFAHEIRVNKKLIVNPEKKMESFFISLNFI